MQSVQSANMTFTYLFAGNRNWFILLKVLLHREKQTVTSVKKISRITSRTSFKWTVSNADWTCRASMKCQRNNKNEIQWIPLCIFRDTFSQIWWLLCDVCYFLCLFLLSVSPSVRVWISGRQTFQLMTGWWCNLMWKVSLFLYSCEDQAEMFYWKSWCTNTNLLSFFFIIIYNSIVINIHSTEQQIL